MVIDRWEFTQWSLIGEISFFDNWEFSFQNQLETWSNWPSGNLVQVVVINELYCIKICAQKNLRYFLHFEMLHEIFHLILRFIWVCKTSCVRKSQDDLTHLLDLHIVWTALKLTRELDKILSVTKLCKSERSSKNVRSISKY